MIGRHLLLFPVSTAVKPAYSVLDHRPNPIQEGRCRKALSRITSRHHTRSVEEHRFDLHGVVLNEIVGLISCTRGRFRQKTERRIRWICAGIILHVRMTSMEVLMMVELQVGLERRVPLALLGCGSEMFF